MSLFFFFSLLIWPMFYLQQPLGSLSEPVPLHKCLFLLEMLFLLFIWQISIHEFRLEWHNISSLNPSLTSPLYYSHFRSKVSLSLTHVSPVLMTCLLKNWYYLLFYMPFPPECKVLLLYSQPLAQWLAHNRCLINVCQQIHGSLTVSDLCFFSRR